MYLLSPSLFQRHVSTCWDESALNNRLIEFMRRGWPLNKVSQIEWLPSYDFFLSGINGFFSAKECFLATAMHLILLQAELQKDHMWLPQRLAGQLSQQTVTGSRRRDIFFLGSTFIIHIALFCIAFKIEWNEDMFNTASPGIVLIFVLVTIKYFTVQI